MKAEKAGYVVIYKGNPLMNHPESFDYGLAGDVFRTREEAETFAEELWKGEDVTWYISEVKWEEK